MSERVIYVVDYPPDERDTLRFGISRFQDLGMDPLVICTVDFKKPGFLKTYLQHDEVTQKVEVIHAQTVQHYRGILKSIPDKTIVITFSYDNIELAGESARKLNFGLINNGGLCPLVPFSRRSGSGFRDKLGLFFGRRPRLRTPWVFTATLATLGKVRLSPLSTRLRFTHNFDYDTYLATRVAAPVHNGHYILFLDEFYPFHPEYAYRGIPAPVPPKRYYADLCRFFDRVEDRFNRPVIIATHPRAWYEHLPDCFGGRKFARHHTARLARDADFVLAHQSFSTNYANLYNKPVVFLDMDYIVHDWVRELIHIQASWFGKIPINLTSVQPPDWEKELTVSQRHYREYRESYIKMTGTPELDSWEIVQRSLLS